MLKKVKEETRVDNAFEFVHKFELQKRFKEKYGVDVENTDEWYDKKNISDSTVIEEFLEEMHADYFLYFVDYDSGYFLIFKFYK